MKKTEKIEKLQLTEAAQQQLVVKSNALIQKTRFNLSTEEQKLILYTISKIKPTDDDLKEYHIDIKDVCAIFGITDNKNNIEYLKQSLKALRDKSFWIYFYETNIESLCSWVNDVDIDHNEKTVRISLNKKLKPYLLHLKNNYTTYELGYALTFKSKYSIRLYELLKSYAYKGEFTITVEDLRVMLNAENLYPEFKEFKRRIIDTALKEINNNSDLYVEYIPIRKERSIHTLIFNIEKVVDEDNHGYFTNVTLNKIRSKDLKGVNVDE